MLAVEEGVVSKSLIFTSISTLHVPEAFADMQEVPRLLNAIALKVFNRHAACCVALLLAFQPKTRQQQHCGKTSPVCVC